MVFVKTILLQRAAFIISASAGSRMATPFTCSSSRLRFVHAEIVPFPTSTERRAKKPQHAILGSYVRESSGYKYRFFTAETKEALIERKH